MGSLVAPVGSKEDIVTFGPLTRLVGRLHKVWQVAARSKVHFDKLQPVKNGQDAEFLAGLPVLRGASVGGD